jgi:hypothetical protein
LPESGGELTLRLEVPGREVESDGRISIDGAGALAGPPLGRSVIDALHTAAARQEVPVTRGGLSMHHALRAPGVTRGWASRCRW